MTEPERIAPHPHPLEAAFVQGLARLIVDAPDNPEFLANHDPGQPLIVEPEDHMAFLAWVTAHQALRRQTNKLAESLPEDVRGGGRALLGILGGLELQAVRVLQRDFSAAGPIACPNPLETDIDDFAAALLIVARDSNVTITGTFGKVPVIASPDMTVEEITNSFFEAARRML